MGLVEFVFSDDTVIILQTSLFIAVVKQVHHAVICSWGKDFVYWASDVKGQSLTQGPPHAEVKPS